MTHGVCVNGVGATQEGTTVANGRISRKGGGGRWADVAHVARATAETVGLGRWLGRAGMQWCRCCSTENEARRQRIFSRAGSKSGQQRRGIAALSSGSTHTQRMRAAGRGQQGRTSQAKGPRKRGRDALARRRVRGSMPGWDAGEAHRREGEGEGCMHADWPPSPPPDQPARGRRGGDRGGIMRGDWPSGS